jgi:hypothetical protein
MPGPAPLFAPLSWSNYPNQKGKKETWKKGLIQRTQQRNQILLAIFVVAYPDARIK